MQDGKSQKLHLGPVMPRVIDDSAAKDDSAASDFEEVPMQNSDSSDSDSGGDESDDELDNLDDQVRERVVVDTDQ